MKNSMSRIDGCDLLYRTIRQLEALGILFQGQNGGNSDHVMEALSDGMSFMLSNAAADLLKVHDAIAEHRMK